MLGGPLVVQAASSPLAKRQYVSVIYRLETLRTAQGPHAVAVVESIEILGDPKRPPVLTVGELSAGDFL
jgi:hypothetical protein